MKTAFVFVVFTVVPVAASVSADETEALKAEITKAVEKVQEAGKAAMSSLHSKVVWSVEASTLYLYHLLGTIWSKFGKTNRSARAAQIILQMYWYTSSLPALYFFLCVFVCFLILLLYWTVIDHVFSVFTDHQWLLLLWTNFVKFEACAMCYSKKSKRYRNTNTLLRALMC